MIHEPKHKNKAPEICILAFFVCATVLLAFSAVEGIAGKGVLQMGGLILFCPMVYILVRYKFTFFTYTVRRAKGISKSLHHEDEAVVADADGSAELPITALPPEALELCVDRRQSRGGAYSECVVRLSEIEECFRLSNDKKERRIQKKRLGRAPTYKYLVNMVGSNQLLLVVTILGKRAFVILEAEGKFADYLCAVAGYNNDSARNK